MSGPQRHPLKGGTMFQRKLDTAIGMGTVSRFAEAIGISRPRLHSWLYGGERPSLPSLEALAEATHTKLEYWTDDSISPKPTAETAPRVNLGSIPCPGTSGEAVAIKGQDPRGMEITGHYAEPVASDGQYVVYDRGVSVETNGDLCIAQLANELILARRYDLGKIRVYVMPNPKFDPKVVEPAAVAGEYPIIAVIGMRA